MGKEEIVARILSDAEGEAERIALAARERADQIAAAARENAQKERAEAQKEGEARAVRIREGREAAARLDAAKIRLAQKRRVIDAVYNAALDALCALDEGGSLRLFSRLLEENAEEGDEVVFARGFAYAEGAAALPVVAKKKLVLSNERADIAGGLLLRGKICDKDLSYEALLERDREAHQSEIALALFGENR